MLQLFIATSVCIYFSSQENIHLPKMQSIDKIFHFFAYFIYGLSLQVFFIALFTKHYNKQVTNEFSKKKIILFTIIIGFIFAVSDEIHQYFVPGRSAELLDTLVDWTGISLSLVFFEIIKNIYKFISNKIN